MRLALLTCCLISTIAAAMGAHAATNVGDIEHLNALTDAHSYNKATNLLDHLTAADAKNPQLRLAGARLYRQMGLFAQSMSEYKQMMREYPNMIEPMIALSQMYMEYLNPRQAEALARHAVALSPHNREARIALCAALIASGYLKEADDQLNTLLKENVNDPQLNYVAYKLFLERGMLDRARRELESAMKIDPSNGEWLVDMSELCKVQGDYDEANRCLERAIATDPSSLEKLNKMAILQEYFFRNYDQAMLEYRKILEIDPDSVTAMAGLDRCKAKKNDLALMLKYQLRNMLSQLAKHF